MAIELVDFPSYKWWFSSSLCKRWPEGTIRNRALWLFPQHRKKECTIISRSLNCWSHSGFLYMVRYAHAFLIWRWLDTTRCFTCFSSWGFNQWQLDWDGLQDNYESWAEILTKGVVNCTTGDPRYHPSYCICLIIFESGESSVKFCSKMQDTPGKMM